MHVKTDLLVIGAGSGGLSVAAGAVQMGADVTLLEGGRMGGDCLNYGCVPSKALIAAGKAAHARDAAARFGVTYAAPAVDYAATKDHVADVIAQIRPNDSQERFERLGVRVIRDYGRFVGRNSVQAGETLITARRIVIATGSSPAVPPVPGLDTVPVETNETIFELKEKPRHLIIIGGGPIGIEMAQAHRRLGCDVTLIEGARALAPEDPEASTVVLDALRAEGVTIIEGTAAREVRRDGNAIEVTGEDGQVHSGSHLLVATGRRPNIDRLDLPAAGIDTTERGIQVDGSLKTTNKRVYAIGDVAGGLQFTHVAGYHAGLIIRSALLGLPAKHHTCHIPHVTFTEPELAQVGQTDSQAHKAHGDKVEVVRFPYNHNDRALAERKADGFIKVMVVKGRPVGVTIVGHQAGEHINLWALVLANRMKMKQVAGMVSPYPTVGEISKRAAGAFFAPKLFESAAVKRVVGLIQRWLP
ncbi:dihydrolipoyl dehydrogenase family protein [Roseovarius sp. SYSU LYC5161]|uniref:dihydrolipoyl dehydrogenase family protein n=1 Tax=Roseovarius halophilus (ex Wu et al. 2025) TaxID=3376060 RepID=UPI002871B9C1|nr:FAD-dependent oxidoreductase [Roseovarius sp.]